MICVHSDYKRAIHFLFGLAKKKKRFWWCSLGKLDAAALRLSQFVFLDASQFKKAKSSSNYEHTARLTGTAALLLVTAVHAVRVGVAVPADGDAVAVLALELVVVALQIAVVLRRDATGQGSASPLTRKRSFFNFLLVPRPIHRRSRDRRRTSTCRRCSGRWCRQTRSRSTDEALQRNRSSGNTEA